MDDYNISKTTVMFIVGRMNPPTPGHVEGLIIPFFRLIRKTAIEEIRDKDCERCISDTTKSYCVTNKACLNTDNARAGCSDGGTLIHSINPATGVHGKCPPQQGLEEKSLSELMTLAEITPRIYLTNTINNARIKWASGNNPADINNICEPPSKENTDRSCQAKKLARIRPDKLWPQNASPNTDPVFVEEIVTAEEDQNIADNKWYVKNYLLENPLDPDDKKYLLFMMLKHELSQDENKDIYLEDDLLLSIINTGVNSDGAGSCGKYGIASAVNCALDLQERTGLINPYRIILAMGQEEANEQTKRDKFCLDGERINDETVKVLCKKMERINLTDPFDSVDIDPSADNLTADPSYSCDINNYWGCFSDNDNSFSASKVRHAAAGDDRHQGIVKTLYSKYLTEDFVNNLFVPKLRYGLFMTNADVQWPQLLRRSGRLGGLIPGKPLPDITKKYEDGYGSLAPPPVVQARNAMREKIMAMQQKDPVAGGKKRTKRGKRKANKTKRRKRKANKTKRKIINRGQIGCSNSKRRRITSKIR